MADHKEITLYIVRHGECLGNVAQKFIEPFEDVLTDVGKVQAELLGDHLKDVTFTRVYASDFPRTAETCRGILRKSKKCSNEEIKLEPRIRERNYSGLIGVDAGDAMDIMTKAIDSGILYLNVEMPKSETVEEFEGRIISFFTELIQTIRSTVGNKESILIVSHGMTIQRLMVLLNTRPNALGLNSWTKNLFAEKLMRNTSYHKIILKISSGGGESSIVGYLEEAHCRDHVVATKDEKAKDCGNYSYLDGGKANADSSAAQQKKHYCTPA